MNEGEKYPVKYAGYGANADADMMEAIIGRRPEGKRVKIEGGYEMRVHDWHDIPVHVQNILREWWEETEFKTYVVRKSDNSKAEVYATLWDITAEERERVRAWEMADGNWYSEVSVTVVDEEGTRHIATSEMIHDEKGVLVNGIEYPFYLNSKDKMLEVANAVREKDQK